MENRQTVGSNADAVAFCHGDKGAELEGDDMVREGEGFGRSGGAHRRAAAPPHGKEPDEEVQASM